MRFNKGNLKFDDITEQSGTTTDSWCTGTSFVDINDDGLLDLYVCVAGVVAPEKRRNIFFINEEKYDMVFRFNNGIVMRNNDIIATNNSTNGCAKR